MKTRSLFSSLVTLFVLVLLAGVRTPGNAQQIYVTGQLQNATPCYTHISAANFYGTLYSLVFLSDSTHMFLGTADTLSVKAPVAYSPAGKAAVAADGVYNGAPATAQFTIDSTNPLGATLVFSVQQQGAVVWSGKFVFEQEWYGIVMSP